jgi:membrane-associated phospholipid phosphatase
LARLRNSPLSRDAIVQILPKFDVRSRSFYVLLAVSTLLTSLSLVATGIDIRPALHLDLPLWACFLIFVATMLRRGGRERVSTSLETIAVMILMTVVLVPLQYPLAAVSGPTVDSALLRADRAMGFDWLAFARFFHDPTALALLTWAYLSMSLQAVFVVVILSWRGQTTRAWHLATATFILFLVAVLLFPIFPADGRFVLCGLRPPEIPVVGNYCDYGPILHRLNDGTLRVLDRSMAIGMVTFPSAHAAAGVLLIWAVWPIRWLRPIFVILNTALCVGAIVIGSHYLIDIVGGVAVAFASVFAARKLVPEIRRPMPT